MDTSGCCITECTTLVFCLEGLRKFTKDVSLDSRLLGRDLNSGPLDYEAGVLTTHPRRTVFLPHVVHQTLLDGFRLNLVVGDLYKIS
jgi:hypothetical protein